MQVIALTGGIGAGKSTVGKLFEQLGAIRIDADQLARDAVAPNTPGLEQIVAQFGEEMRRSDGSLDRELLGEIVFSDDRARSALNRIVHPEVRRLLLDRLAHIERSNPDATVMYEIPLLVETGATGPWNEVITVEAPVERRVARLMSARDMDEREARSRIATQASEAERRAVADRIIDTAGSLSETERQVREMWQELGKP